MADITDNDTVVKTLEDMSPDSDPVFPYHLTKAFTKVFWVAALLGIFYFHAQSGTAAYSSHFQTFLIGVLGVKIYGSLDDFIDLGVEIGAVIPPEEQ